MGIDGAELRSLTFRLPAITKGAAYDTLVTTLFNHANLNAGVGPMATTIISSNKGRTILHFTEDSIPQVRAALDGLASHAVKPFDLAPEFEAFRLHRSGLSVPLHVEYEKPAARITNRVPGSWRFADGRVSVPVTHDAVPETRTGTASIVQARWALHELRGLPATRHDIERVPWPRSFDDVRVNYIRGIDGESWT